MSKFGYPCGYYYVYQGLRSIFVYPTLHRCLAEVCYLKHSPVEIYAFNFAGDWRVGRL